jgi:(2Fe-2S) ferredoxin
VPPGGEGLRGPRRYELFVCAGTECAERRGADAIADRFEVELERSRAQATVSRWSCFGRCTSGVNVLVRLLAPSDGGGPGAALWERSTVDLLRPLEGSGDVMYHGVSGTEVSRIVTEHLEGHVPVEAFRQRARRSPRALADLTTGPGTTSAARRGRPLEATDPEADGAPPTQREDEPGGEA